MVDNKLCFKEYVNQTAKEDPHQAVGSTLFIVSIVSTVYQFYTQASTTHRKRPESVFDQRYKLGLLETDNLEETISVRTKRIILQTITNDTHFIKKFLVKLPLNHYRSLKYRTDWACKRIFFIKCNFTAAEDFIVHAHPIFIVYKLKALVASIYDRGIFKIYLWQMNKHACIQ